MGNICARLTPNYTELDEYGVLLLFCMALLFSMSLGFLFIIVPIAMSIFGLEVYFLRKTGYKFTWDQTLLNLSLGFFDRLMGLYLTERSLILIEQVVSWRLFPGIEKSIFAFVLTFIGVDFIWYLFHRMGHRISLMWGIHLVHHQSDEYNLSVNFALSPLGFLIRSIMYSSLVFLGLPVEYVIMSGYLNAFYQYYLHTEFISTIPWLEHVLVMPDHHKVHHASNEVYLDKNYGGVFIFWDKLFGSFMAYEEKPDYGLTTELPQRDFINIQLFFFKKLYSNFRRYGLQRGLHLLWLGPEHQDSHVPDVLPLAAKPTVSKAVIGIAIYLITYRFLTTTDDWLSMCIAVILNLTAIVLVNGITYTKTHIKQLS